MKLSLRNGFKESGKNNAWDNFTKRHVIMRCKCRTKDYGSQGKTGFQLHRCRFTRASTGGHEQRWTRLVLTTPDYFSNACLIWLTTQCVHSVSFIRDSSEKNKDPVTNYSTLMSFHSRKTFVHLKNKVPQAWIVCRRTFKYWKYFRCFLWTDFPLAF